SGIQQRKSKKVLIFESEGEESEDQGRKIQDIDDDPLVSLVRESMKENSIDFVTPTKASGEAQKEEISPIILEAAKTLSKVASQGVSKEKSTDKGKRYRRRARSVAKNINTGLKMKEKSTNFVTPIKALGEVQEEDISPTILEAAKTLSKVASQGVSKVKSTDKGKRYKRRASRVAKNINTGLDAEEEINTGR
ncbi:hypothetical protein Tco_0913905, partial [Tanacetum coccineum]